MASFKTNGLAFMVACDRFRVCDPASDEQVCCCQVVGTGGTYKFYVIFPCGLMQFTFGGPFTELDPEACGNCANIPLGPYELPDQGNCTWYESIIDLPVSCGDPPFEEGIRFEQVEIRLYCCEHNSKYRLFLQLNIRLDFDNFNSGQNMVYNVELLAIDPQAGCESLRLVDLLPLNLTREPEPPTTGSCGFQWGSSWINCIPPTTVIVDEGP